MILQRMEQATKGTILFLLGVVLFLSSCSSNQAEKHYIFAEKLWTSGNYHEAVVEFEKAYQKTPNTKLGNQALYRAAMTQTLFLGQHTDAIDKFRLFIEKNGETDTTWLAHKEIGEILYTKLKRYPESIELYRSLLKKNPPPADEAEFLYRIAKSQYHLWKFEEAIGTYQEVIKRFPTASQAEKALYQMGVTYFTGGTENFSFEQLNPRGLSKKQTKQVKEDAYLKAIQVYEEFLKKYPNSPLVSEAKFGIASCYEEQDHLEEAYQRYKDLEANYPSPKVIQIKLVRIRDRIAKKSR